MKLATRLILEEALEGEGTMDPARIFTESLTPRPELENSLGPASCAVPSCASS